MKEEEVYIPEEQAVYNDANLLKLLRTRKEIQKNLVRKFIVADLDRDDALDDFLKVDIAHAIGVMEGRKGYEGMDSPDETWIYEFNEDDGKKRGGVAVVRDKKVIDHYPVWEKVD